MHAEFRHVDRDLAGSLHRVRVQRDACFSRDFADLCNRLNRAQLVFASMIVISTVSGRIARRMSSGFTTPSRSTGKKVTATPRFSSARHGSNTALCSIADVMTCCGRLKLPRRRQKMA